MLLAEDEEELRSLFRSVLRENVTILTKPASLPRFLKAVREVLDGQETIFPSDGAGNNDY